MPYPFHKDMHQRANAKVLANANAAILLDDAKDKKQNAEQLKPVLESLLYDAAKRQSMAAHAKNLGRPDAALAVAEVLLEMVRSDLSNAPQSRIFVRLSDKSRTQASLADESPRLRRVASHLCCRR